MASKWRPSFILGCLPIIAFTALVIWATKLAIERYGDRIKPRNFTIDGVSQAGSDKYCKRVFPVLEVEERGTGRVYVRGTMANQGDRVLSHVYVRVKYLTTKRGKIHEAQLDLGRLDPGATRDLNLRLPNVRSEDVVIPGGIIRVEVVRVIFGREE
jgi:hypothetical protein